MEETFTYDDMNRLTGVWLGSVQKGTSAYDCYGRMTAKTADGQAVFSNAVYSMTAKPHAMDAAESVSSVFPSLLQSITYTEFDKVSQIIQDSKNLSYTYGYDHQRIFMEEHSGANVRTKRYVGNCEYVTETSGNTTTQKWLTYLTGPTGVYAVVVTENNVNTIHYILKDNLGSWTTITNSSGTEEQRLSYDAWGNLRNPNTWTGDYSGTPMFDRGYTGHEHLYNFGLINMNGRMYDPVMSSFLSVDQYVQSPSNSQNFNRYAYCLNNPLRYVDPSGWTKVNQAVGYTPNSFSNANDPYAYCRRPLEPRDIGIRQLPQSELNGTWMEGNERHGGGEPTIDPSNLTPSQQEAFESIVSYAKDNSSLFNKLYDCLSNSETKYIIIIGETQNGLPGQFNLRNNSIVFRDEDALVSMWVISEELFHAFQLSENKSLYNAQEFNFEFEAKVATRFILSQLDGGYKTAKGTNFEKMDSFITLNGFDVVLPTAKSIQSLYFLNGYREGADYFKEWNIINNYGNVNYKKATLQTPKSLFKLFKP